MKNIEKTFIFATFFIIISVFITLYIQINGEKELISTSCSYLDPITIDLFAFCIAIFLVIEGIFRVLEHPHASFKKQFTRLIRIAIGSAIITIHILQFLYK